jgi:hypothetical protein
MPTAVERKPIALAETPTAVASMPEALAFWPTAVALVLAAVPVVEFVPHSVEPIPCPSLQGAVGSAQTGLATASATALADNESFRMKLLLLF